MKKLVALLLVVVFAFTVTGCYTQTHIIGEGAKGGTVVEARNWYALWGLVPINTVDTKALSNGNAHYQIKTQDTFLDYVIGFFTSAVSITCRSVEVRY
jgi:hypothetical protein